MKKKFQAQVYKSLEITEQEKEALRAYKGIFYEVINNMLEPGIENEIAFNNTTGIYELDANILKRALEIIQKMYALLYKESIERSGLSLYAKIHTVYRGTTQEDIQRLRKNGQSFRFTSTTYDQNMARGYFSLNWKNPASMRIYLGSDVPYVSLGSVLEEYEGNWEKEILLSPFLKCSEIQNSRRYDSEYVFEFERQELSELSEADEKALEDDLIGTIDEHQSRITRALEIQSELLDLQQKEDSLYRTLNNAESDYREYKKSVQELLKSSDEYEREKINHGLRIRYDDIVAIRKEIEETRKKQSELSVENNKLVKQINAWKTKMRILCMSKCRKQEKLIEQSVQQEEQQIQIRIDEAREQAQKEYKEEILRTCQEKTPEIQKYSQDIASKTSEAIEFQEKIMKIADVLGIKCFKYISNPIELENSQSGITDMVQELITRVEQDLEDGKNGFVCCGVFSDFGDYLKKISNEFSFSASHYLENYEQKQLNALMQAIAEKFTLLRANCEVISLEKEEKEIANRGTIRKLWDKITGQDEKKMKRQAFLREKIKLVKRIIEDSKKGAIQEPNKQYNIEEILADMNIFLSQYSEKPEIKELIEQIRSFKHSIESQEMFTINPENVERIIREKKIKQYPSINEGINKNSQEIILEYDLKETDGLSEYRVSETVTAIERIPQLMKNIKNLMKQYLEESEQEQEQEQEQQK